MEKYLLTNNEIEACFRSKHLNYPSSYSLDELISKTIELNKYNIPIPKNKTIRHSGIPNSKDPIEFVQAFFRSLKPVYKTSTLT